MRQVLVLAELGSFARAAVVLHMSQPALSRSIQTVEQQAGASLFLRSSSGVTPTDLGRVLIQRARQVVQMADELEREVLSNQTAPTGQVCVGSGPYPIDSVITPALTRFIAAHPQVSVRLQLGDWDVLLARLRSRELDFFIAEISTLTHEADLVVEPMADHALYFVGRREHPLSLRDGVKPADTFAYPMVATARIPPRLLAPMLAARAVADGGAAATRAFPAIECNVLSVVKRIVEGSDCLSALTLSSMATELRERRLTLIGSAPWMSARYGLVALKGNLMGAAASRLREFVLDAEAAVTLEEESLLAGWHAAASVERAAPSRRKADARPPR